VGLQVSIIVPVYNVEPYLAACLDSLRRQTCAEIEIICVDDASTDGSLQILTEASRNDARIKVVRHPVNRGLSAARNTGIKAATAPWILFVDSDDLVSARICERTLCVAHETGADVIFFSYAVFADGADLPVEPSRRPAALSPRAELLRRPAFAWTKLIRADLLRSKHIEFPLGYCFEDVPVHWRLVLDSSMPAFIDEALVWYRQRAGSITYRTDWTRADGLRTYDLVKDWLHQSCRWDEYSQEFVIKELANFANTHAYYAIANPDLLSRVLAGVRERMSLQHWQAVIDGHGLLCWQRSYLLAFCRPKHAPRSFMQAPAWLLHMVRDRFRRLYHTLRR
jgi:glycosyltransferase EpsH